MSRTQCALAKAYAAVVVLLCDLGAVGDEPETPAPETRVVSASAASRTPWDGRIDVDFTVYMPVSGTTAAISLSATDGAETYTASTLEDVPAVTTSGTYRVVWNIAEDYPDLYAQTFTITVSASVASFKPDEQSGNYMVIDLSEGTNAQSYAVSYLTNAPAGGWTDEYKTYKMVLRKIPAGTFEMGTRGTDWPNNMQVDDRLHNVTFTNAMWAGVFEVTQRQWELATGEKPSRFNNQAYYSMRPVEMVNYSTIRGASQGQQWPSSASVDSSSFIGVLRSRTANDTLDLPTEAQWEYACRAGTTTALNNGQNLTNSTSDASLGLVARYGQTGSIPRNCDPERGTAVVGMRDPNAWGLFDMHGNVWEWCLDYGTQSLETASVTNPPGAAYGSTRILRGGCYSSTAGQCIAGYRNEQKTPSVTSGTSTYGFRLFGRVPNVPEWDGATSGTGVAAPISYDGRIIVSLAEAVDAPSLVFRTGTALVTNGGDRIENEGDGWVATNAVKCTGTHSACSSTPEKPGRGYTESMTWMSTKVKGAGTLSFFWKVSCEQDETGNKGWTRMMVFADGVEIARTDGQPEVFERISISFTNGGEHSIMWEFWKDKDSEPAGEDCGWVDGVTWAPDALILIFR